jgi:thiol-disulfide isomerase/thioredoxin
MPQPLDLLVLGLLIGAVAVTAAWWRRRDGRLRAAHDRLTRVELAALGAPAGIPVLLQFTAPGCRPCAASWRVLEAVSAERGGLALHAVDVGRVPQVAREHRVLRAPTVLVVGADGRVHARSSGVPDRDQLAATVDDLLVCAA